MSTYNHAVVWIDHSIAKIFFLGRNDVDVQSVQAHLPHNANAIGASRVHDGDPTFLQRVDEALRGSKGILIMGPGIEKASLLKCLKWGHHLTKQRSIEIGPCDHPSHHEIIELGRHHFRLGEPA